MSKTKKRPPAAAGGGGEKRGGRRPGAGRPFGAGAGEPPVFVPKHVVEPLVQLGEFFGMRPQDLAILVLGGLVRELHEEIGEDALRRFATLEGARLLKGMGNPARRLAHYNFVTRPGLDLDVAEDEWAEVLALADGTPTVRIVEEIEALRRDASAALARLAAVSIPSSD